MAQFQGRVCDRKGCNVTVDGASSTPPGWFKLVPIPKSQDGQTPKEEFKEYCSSYCLAIDAYVG